MKLHYFKAYREDGSVLYSGDIHVGDEDEAIDFYTNGHPSVHRFELITLEQTDSREIEPDRSPEAVEAWHERTGR